MPVARRVQLGTLLLAAAVLAALLLIPSGAGGQRPQKKPQPRAKTRIGKIVVPVKAETIRLDFQQSREPKTRSFTLKADPPLGRKPTIRKELAGDLTNDNGGEFPEDQVTVTTERTEFGNVRVKVQLDPKGRVEVPAGRYTGTLAVAGRLVEPGTVSIDATLRDSAKEAFLWAILGFIVGIVIKVAGDFSRAKPNVPNAPTRVPTAREYVGSGAFISSLLLGFVGAAIAFALAYYDNPVWGADPLDDWKLAAAAFSGVLTGATGADLVKPLRPPAA